MRKSKILRLQQAQDLVAGFTPTHQQVFAWDYRFLSDITSKLGAGRKISKKQRDILDEKIEKGIPSLPTETPEQVALTEALEIIAEIPQFSWEHRVGGDMLVKLRKGWSISEKQQKLIDDIIKRAKNWQAMGIPSGGLRSRVALVKELAKCYASNYWLSHAKAAAYIRNVEGNKYSEKDVENAEYAVRGELKRWNKCLEKFPTSAYCKVPCRNQELAEATGVKIGEKGIAIVVSEPRIERGGIMLDVLIAGKVIGFYARNVTMR